MWSQLSSPANWPWPFGPWGATVFYFVFLNFCFCVLPWQMQMQMRTQRRCQNVSCREQGSGACLLSLLPACKLHKILPGYKSILLFTEYVICGECGSREAGKLLLPESIQHPAEPTKVFFFFFAAVEMLQPTECLSYSPTGCFPYSFSRQS